MRDVLDVGEVEEVLVGAELETGLVGAVDVDQVREDLHVGWAEDACGADGEGEEVWGGGGTVCG